MKSCSRRGDLNASFQTLSLLVGRAFAAGGDSYLAEIQALVVNWIRIHVIFAGFRSDPNQILRAADISVKPSSAKTAAELSKPFSWISVGGLQSAA